MRFDAHMYIDLRSEGKRESEKSSALKNKYIGLHKMQFFLFFFLNIVFCGMNTLHAVHTQMFAGDKEVKVKFSAHKYENV